MTSKNILVIEDERPLQAAIKDKLVHVGFNVTTGRSVQEGLNLLNSANKIDVIWLDHYLLGEEDGLDFVAKVKNHAEWQKIPIFVVSNTAGSDKVKSYLQLGINKFFTKSDYRLEQIIDDINAALKDSG